MDYKRVNLMAVTDIYMAVTDVYMSVIVVDTYINVYVIYDGYTNNCFYYSPTTN